MATTAANEPVLELPSLASRLAVWSALHQSVLRKARPLSTLYFGSVKAGDIQSFLNRMGRPMDLSEVRYWTGRLWHTLPFEPPWHFPFPVDLTLEQEGQVTTALGTLQEILEGAAWDPAFDPEFLKSNDVSTTSSCFIISILGFGFSHATAIACNGILVRVLAIVRVRLCR